MSQVYLVLDYETRSEADLLRFGAFEYARHPSTEILCAAWRLGTREELANQLKNKVPAKVWSPAIKDGESVYNLTLHIFDADIKIIAHNAFFEQVITKFTLNKYQPNTLTHFSYIVPERWICTASLARAVAIPGSLEGSTSALKLSAQKDMIGHRLMMKLSKPRKPSKNNPSKWHQSKRDLFRLMEYCQADVDAETELLLKLPELDATERKVWLLDQKINFRGFEVDRVMVDKVLGMIKEETERLNDETLSITGGAIATTNRRAATLEWLQGEGVNLPDLRAKTVSDMLTKPLPKNAHRILEIRQMISKTSTAKYVAFEERSRSDSRVRDNLLYHGASTGRWASRGVQIQNLARGSIKDTPTAATILREGDLEMVRFLYGDPMTVFSSCLRSVIKAPEGKQFYCADYAAIEARVLFWVADYDRGIKAYFNNQPMYEEMAAVIFNLRNVEDVTEDQRAVGKFAILGAGYGMGWKKFILQCASYGIALSEEVAQKAIASYRNVHAPVPKLWANLERVAITAVKNPTKKFKINHTEWFMQDQFLKCRLPSGRCLSYPDPLVKYEPTPWGEKRAVLYHAGVNPMTKKWESSGTYGGRLTENVVQAIARDLMAWAMLRVEDAGYQIVLSVHDELLAEAPAAFGSVEEFEKLMATAPQWANGCPIKVKGWSGLRYRK